MKEVKMNYFKLLLIRIIYVITYSSGLLLIILIIPVNGIIWLFTGIILHLNYIEYLDKIEYYFKKILNKS